jgi:hypothetical protein
MPFHLFQRKEKKGMRWRLRAPFHRKKGISMKSNSYSLVATRSGPSFSLQKREFRASPVCRQTSEDNQGLVSVRAYAVEQGVSVTAARRLLTRAKVSIIKLDSANEVIPRQSADERVAAYLEATQANRRKSAKKAAATRKKNKTFKVFLKALEKKASDAKQEVADYVSSFLYSALSRPDGSPLDIQTLGKLIAHADSLKTHQAVHLYESLLAVLEKDANDPHKVVIDQAAETDDTDQVEIVSILPAKELPSQDEAIA